MPPQREWLEKDYYAVLGVGKDASAADIKKAYRKLANAYHPDRNPDDPSAEGRFKEVSEAYAVLGDEERRAEYDEFRRLGASGFAGMGGRGFGGGGPGQGGFTFEGGDLQDLLRTIFQGGTSGDFMTYGPDKRPRKGMDLRADVHLSFEDALAGVRTRLRVGDEELTVRIPAGIKDGATVRVTGRGGPGMNGGPRGDVLVHVHVDPHPVFGRRGDDVTLEVPVTFTEAALGTKLKVPTPDGDHTTIKLPAGTASGRTFRIRGKGAPTAHGNGDLLVTVRVEVPTKLSRKQKQLLEELAALEDTADRDERLFAHGSRR